MITFTPFQERILNYKNLGKISYCDMWLTKKQLGYSSKGDEKYYEVTVAEDISSPEIRSLILLHEVGHIFFRHLDIDISSELEAVYNLFKEKEVPFSKVFYYGGPLRFINLAMDLEVNSKAFTFQNLKHLNSFLKTFSFHLHTTDSLSLEVLDSFRDYYVPLILRLKDTEDKENIKDFPEWDDIRNQENFNFEKLSFELQDSLKKENYNFEKDSFRRELNSREYSEITNRPLEHLEVLKESSTVLKSFILNNISKGDLKRKDDFMKLYNWGVRKNKSILYRSSKRKKSYSPKKICFILDVSNSMELDCIASSLISLKEIVEFLSPNSQLITWNTYKVLERGLKEFNLTEIEIGGGTDIAGAIEYLEDKGFSDCFIYSDFETAYSDLIKVLKSTPVNIFGIASIKRSLSPIEEDAFLDLKKYFKNFVAVRKEEQETN